MMLMLLAMNVLIHVLLPLVSLNFVFLLLQLLDSRGCNMYRMRWNELFGVVSKEFSSPEASDMIITCLEKMEEELF